MKKSTMVLFTSLLALTGIDHSLSAATHTIQVSNFAFSPSTLNNVVVGDIVKWVWVSGTHTTTSTVIPVGAQTWDRPITSGSQTYSYTVSTVGTYNYKCTPHAGMGMVGSFTAINVPSVTTNSATSVLNTSATLNGTVNANNNATTVTFEYGLSPSYGLVVAAVPSTVSGTSPVAVSANLSGLLPDTTYHYRVVGTNAAGTTFGNNMTFTTPPQFKSLSLTIFLEGLYAATGTMNQAQNESGPQYGAGVADQVVVELRAAAVYSDIQYSSGPVNLSTGGLISISTIPLTLSESYYITIRHRNSIETTSALPVSFTGNSISYNFSTSAAMAYGDNLKDETGGYFSIWGGDVSQDGIVDSGDMNPVDNESTAITFGYLPEDVNGDGIVDSGDMNIVDNNSTFITMAILP